MGLYVYNAEGKQALVLSHPLKLHVANVFNLDPSPENS